MLVDDHAVVRAGYRRLIELERDMMVVEEAASGEEAYEQLLRRDVDVVILDLSMPGHGGFEALKRIKSRFPKQRIIVFTMHDSASIARRALSFGAAAYLTKSNDPDILIKAIREVWQGQTVVDDNLKYLVSAEESSCAPHDSLLPREFQIFLMLAGGESVDSIAAKLKMSEKSVANYQSVIRKKLNIDNQIELIKYAEKHDLLTTFRQAG
jgi:DNA-binding NarL/FixJ family response regulator